MPATERLLSRLRAIPEGEVAATARKADMMPRHLQRLRAGGSLDVRLSTLEKLAHGLGESIGEMLGETARPMVKAEPRRPELPALLRLLRQIEAIGEDARELAASLPEEDRERHAVRVRRHRRSEPA